MESLTLTNYCFLKINCIILLQNNLPANWIGNWKAKKEIKRMFWLIGFVILNFKFERDSNAKVSNLWWKIFLSFWCMVESFFWLIDARHLLLIGLENESDGMADFIEDWNSGVWNLVSNPSTDSFRKQLKIQFHFTWINPSNCNLIAHCKQKTDLINLI